MVALRANKIQTIIPNTLPYKRQAVYPVTDCRLFNFREEAQVIANYHLNIKVFSRGKGASAVAKAAYRAAEMLISEYSGAVHDYTRKQGIVHTEILLPDHAPLEFSDRSVLWNAVEMSERNSNAQLAREIEFSLPVELSREQNIILAREFVMNTFVENGMCADLCVHDKGDGNPHAHVMLTLRPLNEDGTWAAKSRKEYILDDLGERIILPSGAFKSRKISTVDWNEQTKADDWRKAWGDIQNRHLEKHGFDVRVDHRSYERQGIDKIPAIHMGAAACQMEQKGILTDKGNYNRHVKNINKEMRQAKARIRKVKTWLFAQPIINPPSFLDVMNRVADSKNLNSRWQSIANLKTRAEILMFLHNNNITDMDCYVEKVRKIHEDLKSVSDQIMKTDRRLDTLALHLAHVENHKKYKGVYKKYQSLAPENQKAGGMFSKKPDSKIQVAFYKKHTEEIEFFRDAKAYFDNVMNGRKDLPIAKWRAEQKELTIERFALAENFYRLKGEVKNTEVLRRGIEELMQVELKAQLPERKQEITLQ